MKRVTVWMLGVGLLYYLLGVSLPHAIALKRGGTVVSTSGWYGDSVTREACVNGGSLVYPNQAADNGVEFGVINKDDGKHVVVLEMKDRFLWCLNGDGDMVVIASSDEWWRVGEDQERPITLVTVHNGMVERRYLELPGGPYDLYINDVGEGWLLGHITQIVDGNTVGGLFMLSTQDSELLIPPLGTDQYLESGVIWNNGFVYRDKDHVVFRHADGSQQILGKINNGTITGKNDNSVAWTSRHSEGPLFVRGYSRDVGNWEQSGIHPFLTEDDKLVVVDRELGGVAAVPVSGGKRVLIVKSEKARFPIYFAGKIYWTEETFDLSFPIQLVLYKFLGGRAPQLTQSHLFAISVTL